METGNSDKIEDILVEAGLISSKRLQEIKESKLSQSDSIDKLLLSDQRENYKKIMQQIAEKMGVEFVDLENVSVDKNAVAALNPALAKRYSVFPFDMRDNYLYLAMQNPDDIFLIDEIKVFAQVEIKPFLGDSKVIGKAIEYFYGEFEDSEERNTKNGEGAENSDAKETLTPGAANHSEKGSWETIEEQIRSLLPGELKMENVGEVKMDIVNRIVYVDLKFKY